MSDEMRGRNFPIMAIGYRADEEIRAFRAAGVQQVIISIPWAAIAPHEEQAQRNHSQSLKRLAERGGLSACEAVAIMENRRHHRMSAAAANERLRALLAQERTDGR